MILIMLIPSCIIPYINDDIENPEILSITGSLIKGDSIQLVEVNKTTSLAYTQPSYVENCDVKVLDEFNNEFVFTDMHSGNYTAVIPDDALIYGRSYKLVLTSPTGQVYESEYETLLRNTEIDSVYWEREQQAKIYSEKDFWGYQYYVDVVAPDTNSRFYRWILNESYEYTSASPLTFIIVIVDEELEVINMDWEWEYYRCWAEERVPGPFITNTMNLTVNEKKQIPLHFVSNRTDRLKIMYSLMVEQYAISEGAYNYWKQQNDALSESGGLYTSQPAQPVTNIYCTDDCSEKVLGYFWTAAKTEIRIFTPRDGSLPVYDFLCPIYKYDPTLHKKIPRYIYVTKDSSILYTGDPACFDCRLRGGVLNKPDFWID